MEMLLRSDRAARDALFARLGAAGVAAMRADWMQQARPAQIAPEGDWRIWMLMAGRGFGKTRAGAEWVRGIAEGDGRARIALIGASPAEARSVMVEGESGLLAIAPEWNRPMWYPALRRLQWRSGAVAHIYGASDPEALRGPQFSHAWADEIGKWPLGIKAWRNLELALRLGERPRVVATTTPRPVPLVRALLGRIEQDVVLTRGATLENGANLPPAFLESVTAQFGGTRLGRQELDGELVEDIDGALWTRALIEQCRVAHVPGGDAGGVDSPVLTRVVVAVDPPAGAGDGDACGIIVAGTGGDGRAYVIADASVAGLRPEGWARAVVHAAHAYGADRVVAEANNGGAMIESVLRAVDANLPLRLVHASRGKVARAEPVAALYEAGRVAHRGAFPMLEDQMCGMLTGGVYAGPGRSPDRADALVWGISWLMLGKGGGEARVRGV
ncbi:DNA-packaging protein [Sphingobium algorifonticola]|uniref:ATP-binding protein n=1 Tax=Sphingobium algorifonticola TaxID=2008318 RepID=A0A437JDI2_9SPHN|nr:terminase family protein [Sphingobium algorifonticola]RVT43986.1 ATP-binding protein [Sphingobium algorifonticola]